MATASPAAAAAAAAAGRVATVATETITGTRVLVTIDGFSKLKEASEDGIGGWNIESDRFLTGGRSWYIELRPDGDRQRRRRSTCCNGFYILEELNPSPLLGESFQLRCDLSVLVGEIAAVRPPDMHRHLGSLLASQVGADVTFDVGGELFTAHKCILAARSPVFMAELFGPAPGKEKVHGNTAANPIRIDGIEPRVFRALLNFIYTESLPEVNGNKDKVAMAQGLLLAADRHGSHRLKDACVRVVKDLITKLEACVRVMKDLLTKVVNEGEDMDKVVVAQGMLIAADRYGMERLQWICGQVLCNRIDACTVMALLQLANSHGWQRLKEDCVRVIKDLLAKVAAN
ncbi:unnamed protein product [Urochloa decumbens]|uniref:BTB domain-containing protein n=1 Tax=Urochloa decumbens TaxID=240449 RepID=A0ABC9AH14_9POAL